MTITPEGCTIVQLAVPSAAMNRSIQATVVLPPAYQYDASRRFPILYAMHGTGAPHNCWSEMIPLRKALADQPMIVAMFDADNASWYLDSPQIQTNYLRPPPKDAPGQPAQPPIRSLFTTFFFNEFIPYVDQQFRTNSKQRLLTGFSMGGFGAFHYLLTKPDMFMSVSALSGAFMNLAQPAKEFIDRLATLLGDYDVDRSGYRAIDLQMRIIDQTLKNVRLPPIFFHCGSEDEVPRLLESNRDFARFLAAMKIPARYLETEGKHNWPFWRDASAGIIDFHWRTLHPQ
ncbi:MAG: alpha/beta hydrolase-fold protein [Planctomycetota bacterium]